ncbi:MAG TPA: flagellar biosynthetic protein FliO, partial [Acidimicrobiales bacterium]|nr:flagellar biosynthetic protein FliO [Acidimicrobiales bacterium]
MTPPLLAAAAKSTLLQTPSVGGTLTKAVLFVLALALIALYMRRRAAGGKGKGKSLLGFGAGGGMADLRVISRQPVGKGVAIAVVEWNGRKVLAGITPTSVSFYQPDGTAGSLPEPFGEPIAPVEPGDAPPTLRVGGLSLASRRADT